jgi:uncharacterized protein (DUF1778 family)
MAEKNHARQIKLFLLPADHNRLRIAAALKGMSMSAFCHKVALAEADRLTKGIVLPAKCVRANTEGARSGQ